MKKKAFQVNNWTFLRIFVICFSSRWNLRKLIKIMIFVFDSFYVPQVALVPPVCRDRRDPTDGQAAQVVQVDVVVPVQLAPLDAQDNEDRMACEESKDHLAKEA